MFYSHTSKLTLASPYIALEVLDGRMGVQHMTVAGHIYVVGRLGSRTTDSHISVVEGFGSRVKIEKNYEQGPDLQHEIEKRRAPNDHLHDATLRSTGQ